VLPYNRAQYDACTQASRIQHVKSWITGAPQPVHRLTHPRERLEVDPICRPSPAHLPTPHTLHPAYRALSALPAACKQLRHTALAPQPLRCLANNARAKTEEPVQSECLQHLHHHDLLHYGPTEPPGWPTLCPVVLLCPPHIILHSNPATYSIAAITTESPKLLSG